MPDEVLTRRALNRALLGRQLLLERRRMGVPEAVELGVRLAEDYLSFGSIRALQSRFDDMEPAGIEPAPSALQTPRSTN